MKKVIKGAEYNTETAEKICERNSKGHDHSVGAVAKKTKQLFRTKSGKFFFYIKKEFRAYVDINNDDLNPIIEEEDLIDEKIIPINYKLASVFVSELSADVDSQSKLTIAKYFPNIENNSLDGSRKMQKKFYLSEKASWYLDMMLTESKDTNSSMVERLIVEEYRKLYAEGIMNNDPYSEMEG